MNLSLLGEWGNVASIKRSVVKVISIALAALGIIAFVTNKKEWVVRMYLVLASLILTSLIIESYFRLFNPQLFTNEHSHLYQYDQTYGWRFISGKKATVTSALEFHTSVAINSSSMRDKEYTLRKPAGTRRIAVLGDSFVSGLQVSDQDVFSKRLEKSLENTEVLNFGVPGYGPTQEFLLYKNEVVRYLPDITLLVFLSAMTLMMFWVSLIGIGGTPDPKQV